MFEHGICLVLKYVDHLGMGVIKQQDDTVGEVLLDVCPWSWYTAFKVCDSHSSVDCVVT